MEAARAEVAAELVDAGRIPAAMARTTMAKLPTSDPDLLRHRPQRRPPCVPAAAPLADRTGFYSQWLDGIDGAEERVALDCDGWRVIGEVTEITLLNQRHPREVREQALRPDGASRLFTRMRRTAHDARRPAALGATDSLIVRTIPSQLGYADGFLVLHPGAAAAAGLEPDDADLLAWRLDGKVEVRSIWWRSGFAYWRPYSNRDEVGDGWLVVARPAGLRALLDAFPDVEVTWAVRRRVRHEDSDEEAGERFAGGTRQIANSAG